jgi:hypothetical protein
MNKKVVLCIILMLFLAEAAFLAFPSLKLDTSASLPRYAATYQAGLTQVSGIITENTTWTLDGSPYIVVADVCVDIDIFLTIEPGVVVKFGNGTSLIIDGCFIAKGNSTNKVTFTSNNAVPASGDWGTINIRSYSTGANYIDYIKIEYSSTALTLAADCNITASALEHNNNGISLQNATNVSVKNAKITNNAGSGIDGSISQSMEIQSSNVSMNGAGASVSCGRDILEPPPIVHIRNSTFDGNAGNGVNVVQVDPEIDNCSISGNGGGVSTTGNPGYVHLKLWNSNVSNNMGTGVAGGGGLWSQSLIDVQNCTFLNNTIGMAIAGNATNCDINGSSQYGVYAHIRQQGLSLHKCNISNSGLDGINVGYQSWCDVSECDISNNKNGVNFVEPQGSANIYASTIRNNSDCGIIAGAPAFISLQDSLIEQSQYGISGAIGLYGLYGTVSASESIIANNTIGVLAKSLTASSTTIANNSLVNVQVWREGAAEGSCALEYCNVYNSTTNIQCDSGTLEYCNISNSNVGVSLSSGSLSYCNIYNNTGYSVQNMAGNGINATYNWWGTANETEIQNDILDFYDNATLGRVLYKPFLTSLFETGHDVAVTNVNCSKGVVGLGQLAFINISVENHGEYSETFNLTCYCNNTAITQAGGQNYTAVTLSSGNITTINIKWNTTGFTYGSYNISAHADTVPNEINISDNTFTDGTILVTILGDINGDFKVSLSDLVILALAYRSKPGDAKWNPNADINGNSVVDLQDLTMLAIHYEQHYP